MTGGRSLWRFVLAYAVIVFVAGGLGIVTVPEHSWAEGAYPDPPVQGDTALPRHTLTSAELESGQLSSWELLLLMLSTAAL